MDIDIEGDEVRSFLDLRGEGHHRAPTPVVRFRFDSLRFAPDLKSVCSRYLPRAEILSASGTQYQSRFSSPTSSWSA